MRFSLQGLLNRLCWIIFCLAAWEVNAQVQIDHKTCQSGWKNVHNALLEVVNIAQFAYQRQIGLRDGTLSAADMRVTFNTFIAYFSDPQYWPLQSGAQVNNADEIGKQLISKFSFL